MRDRAHENLVELLRRFMDEPAARAAHKDIEAGERWLDACPAPRPEEQILAAIHTRMVLAAQRRSKFVRLVRASLTAAAVIALAALGLLGPHTANRSHPSYAAIIPATIWESDDLTADDLDLAYFSSEIRQIEAQVQALDADMGDSGLGLGTGGVPEELEMELMALQTEFWKG